MLVALADPDQILQQLSTDLMSPYCAGRTIAACPSPQARQLEDHILAEAKSGKSRDQIEQELVARFGRDIVGYEPPPVLLYGSIGLGLVALLLLVRMGRRWSSKPRTAAATATATAAVGAGAGAAVSAAPSAAELERLEDALDEFDDF